VRKHRIQMRNEIAMVDKIASGIGNVMIAWGWRSYCVVSGETIALSLCHSESSWRDS